MASHSDRKSPVALVTGAQGFTGRYVCDALRAANYQVVGTVAGGAVSGAQEVELDITRPDACRAVLDSVRPDYIVHLAAISHVQHADLDGFYRVNTVGTTHLLQAALDLALPVRKIVIASSANIYGNTGGMLDEDTLPQPVNHYAASKLAMEHMVRTYTDRLPILLTRPFNYTGVGQSPSFLVAKIVQHFRQRAAVIELGNLDIERDFSDVRDVATMYRQLLECADQGQVVNICSGQTHSLRGVIEMLQEITGHQIKVQVNPKFVRASDVRTLCGAPVRLNRMLGQVNRIPFRETLAWMVQA